MIEIYARPVADSLVVVPAYREAISELKQGDIYRAECYRLTARSGAHHRYVFGALMRFLHSFVSDKLPFEPFRSWMTIGAGHFHVAPNGCLLPRSWAFGEMDQDQFRDLVNRIIDYAIREVIPSTVRREDINETIETLLSI